MDKARHTIGRELVAETEGVVIVRYHCKTCGSSKRPQARRTASGEPVAQLRGAVRMNVPVSQLPLGSPLASGDQGQ